MSQNNFNLIDELRAAFPEIEGSYQEELRSWQGKEPGDYNIVGFVFKPYLRAELEKGTQVEFLRRLSEFLEKVCASGDVNAINVVWLKLFKLLLGKPSYLNQVWSFLGPATRSDLVEAASRWDIVRNLPPSRG